MGDRRLLAIDDEKGLLAIVQDIGQNAGYEVVATSDASYFLQQAREWHPTLVLMDLQMPDVDGVELLRAMSADKLNAPIVLMSGAGNTTVLFLSTAISTRLCRLRSCNANG